MFSSWAIASSALTPAAVCVYSPHITIIWFTDRIRVRTLVFQSPVSGSLTDQSARPNGEAGFLPGRQVGLEGRHRDRNRS